MSVHLILKPTMEKFVKESHQALELTRVFFISAVSHILLVKPISARRIENCMPIGKGKVKLPSFEDETTINLENPRD